MITQDNVISMSSNSRYTTNQVKNVFAVMGKHHEGQIFKTALDYLEVIPSKAEELAAELGYTVTDNPKKTIDIINDEVLDLISLIKKGQNEFARHYLMYLCSSMFVNYWKRHQLPDATLSKKDNYWDTMALAYVVLDECIDYYQSLHEAGKIKAYNGHESSVGFAFFLKLRMADIGRTITSENRPFSFGDGIAKNLVKIRKFCDKYEQEHCGEAPNLEQISKVINIKNHDTVRMYMDLYNTTFVCGNNADSRCAESGKYHGSADGPGTVKTIYEMIPDGNSEFAENDRVDQLSVQEAIKKLSPTASKIIRLKYGFGEEPHTDAEVQEILKIDEKLYKKTLKETINILSIQLKDFQYNYA